MNLLDLIAWAEKLGYTATVVNDAWDGPSVQWLNDRFVLYVHPISPHNHGPHWRMYIAGSRSLGKWIGAREINFREIWDKIRYAHATTLP